MERKTAISVLKDIKNWAEKDKRIVYAEALTIAINSLMTDEAYQLEYEQPEFCEDCISRKEVDRLANKYLKEPTDNHVAFYEQFLDLPSVLPKEPTTKNDLGVDCINRKSIKQKLQEHHDFFVNAYGGFSNLPQNDKSRVDEITNCIAMVVNEPSVTPQEPRWISVSERLPQEAFGCLVTVIDTDIHTQEEFENILPYFVGYDGETWNDADGESIPFEVIAWMPLPKAYREVEE